MLRPALLVALALTACKSTESSPGTDTKTAPVTTTGPLASLESAPFVNEVWTSNDDGTQIAMIYYAQQNVRVSASCRNGGGQLACDALKQLRQGPPVKVPKSAVKGNISAGTKGCTALKNTIVHAHDAQANEDGFCKFPDGSLAANGSLEQYGVTLE